MRKLRPLNLGGVLIPLAMILVCKANKWCKWMISKRTSKRWLNKKLESKLWYQLKVHLEGGWTVEMLIKYKNTIIKMNNQMVNSKTRSEAGFPIKGSRASPLNSSRLRVEVHNCLLPWIRQTNKYEWCKQYVASRVKCNESNNTSVSNIERVKWKKW